MSNTAITITKKDIIWSYIAKFLALASNVIILPFILHMLSPEEVGMNYLMITICAIVMLIDFGFGPQFGRNFTYVYSGAQTLLKEGVQQSLTGDINYHLLAVLLKTAKMVYKKMSLYAMIAMMTLGTCYVYQVTDGFTNVDNSLLVWIVFSLSTYFNIYFAYYTTLLTGSGMMAESSIALILARITNMLLSVTFLYLGFGLMSIALANLIAPFSQRIYCYKVYFTDNLKHKIETDITKKELEETFSTIWFNAKKIGINSLGAYAVNKFGLFLMGIYLPLTVVGSFGLLIQLSGVVTSVASIYFVTYLPKFSNYRVTGQREEFISLFSLSFIIFLVISVFGGLIIVFGGDFILELIGSNTLLPNRLASSIYILIAVLETNHSNFATLITTNNEVPFVKTGLISGLFVALFSFCSLQFTSLGLIGVILSQGIVQLSFNNWYWPHWVLKEMKISFWMLVKNGLVILKKSFIIKK